MKKKFLVLLIFVGTLISACAAVMSVSGLTEIFKGATYTIIGMGAVLELAKVIISVYTHMFWRKAKKLLISYLTFALVILMSITSLGIYGYLSKAYLTSTDTSFSSTKMEALSLSVETSKSRIKTLMEQISAVNGVPKEEKTNWHYSRVRWLSKEIETITKELESINEQYISEKLKMSAIEAEVGPLKYLAYIIYGNSEKESIDRAVQLFIILIVLVFDPLAILMILSGVHGLEIIENAEPQPQIIQRKEVIKESQPEPEIVQPEPEPQPEPQPQIAEETKEELKPELTSQPKIIKKRPIGSDFLAGGSLVIHKDATTLHKEGLVYKQQDQSFEEYEETNITKEPSEEAPVSLEDEKQIENTIVIPSQEEISQNIIEESPEKTIEKPEVNQENPIAIPEVKVPHEKSIMTRNIPLKEGEEVIEETDEYLKIRKTIADPPSTMTFYRYKKKAT